MRQNDRGAWDDCRPVGWRDWAKLVVGSLLAVALSWWIMFWLLLLGGAP